MFVFRSLHICIQISVLRLLLIPAFGFPYAAFSVHKFFLLKSLNKFTYLSDGLAHNYFFFCVSLFFSIFFIDGIYIYENVLNS